MITLILIFLISPINLILCNSRVTMKFKTKSVVPDVINDPPQNELVVVFNRTKAANLGNSIKSKYLQTTPILYLDPTLEIINHTATVLMVDADAPTRRNPDNRNVLHWMVVNFRGYNSDVGETKVEYLPPNPQKGSGQHRYVVLLYKHQKITFNETTIGKNSTEAMRYKFSVKDFEKKYKLGPPFAGNFFKCSFHYN